MYKDLSLKEKAKVIREGVRLGLTSIDDILSLYNDAISYLKGDPIVSPYGQWKYPGKDTIIPSNNITMDNVNYPVLGVSDTGDAKVMMPWNNYKFRGSMVYEHPLIGNLALEGKKFNKKWRALDNILYNVYPDTTFTREKTGVGDIEVFDRKNGDTIIYPNGYKYINPYPDLNTIVYNPNTNDALDIRLDALHLMPLDATYDALNTLYRNNALGSDVYYIANKRYEEDKRRYGKDNIDSFSQYYNNEADALLRNMFIEGTPEYIRAKRYYPNKQQLREWNIDLLPYINEIQEYLETGVHPKYILPEVTVTPNEYKKGGSIHIKPENRGKFTALKKRTGHSASWFKAHGTPALKKMATFALNARHWKHLDGGYSDKLNNLNWKMHHSAGSGNIGSVWYNYTFDPENNYYNGTHYVGQNLLGKTQEQLPLGRDHVNLYTYGDETGFERINNATPITVNGETYDYRLYYGNILPFDTIYLKPESLPVVDSMIKHKNILGVNTDYFIMDLNDAETYPKQYKNVFSHRNIKKGMPLDDTRAVSVSPKKDENGYYLDAFDVIDYKKTTGFAGNRLDKIVERENILNGPYILRQKIPVVFDKNKESNGPLLNLISQYKDNGMTWEEYLIKYSPSYNKTYGRHNQDAVNIEHKRKHGGHLFLEDGYLQEAPKTFVAKQYDINLPLDWNAESWLGERADNYKGPKYTDEDIKIFESHVPEYRYIEENARNNGTWLKMPDGTTWNGDPRDWVLMQSKAFKNNYEDKVWYTGLAEWPTTVNYNGQDILTDKVKRARYHNGLMWFSDNPGYALYFADYVDLKGLNSREWQYSPNGGYEKAPYINGMVFTAAIPKNSEIHSLLAPKEGTHDLWQKMPYVLTETGIERIPEYKLHQNKKGRNLINDDILNNKLITDDLVNHAENLGWKGLYMFNVDDGPVFINKPGKNYIPQESLHLEGVDTSRGTINEFISLPGLTEKLKFIHGNNGDFNPNIEDKYSYLTKDNYENLIKFGGKIKKKKV